MSNDLTLDYTITAHDVKIEARFSYYTISTSASWGSDDYGVAGTYTKLNEEKITVGETVTLTAIVNKGYNFDGWYRDGICLSKDLTYSFEMTAESRNIEALYSYYTVSTYSFYNNDDYGMAGTFTKLEEKKVSIGETVTLTATVNDGYNFEGWYRDGICLSKDLTYSFEMTAESRNIEALYSYYTISTFSYSDDFGIAGSFTKLEGEKVSLGKTVTLTATVNNAYNFEGWFRGDVCVCKDLTYTFEMTNENRDVEARYSYYTVSTGSMSDDWGAAGTYTKLDEKKFSIGETVTVSATVNAGYKFLGWHINGVKFSSSLTYSFTMTNSSVGLSAEYEKIDG